MVEIDSCYNVKRLDMSLIKVMTYVKKMFPFIDETIKSDIERFVRKKYSNHKRDEKYLQKKRDFLNAAWNDYEKNINYMKFDKSIKDVEEYMKSNGLRKPYHP